MKTIFSTTNSPATVLGMQLADKAPGAMQKVEHPEDASIGEETSSSDSDTSATLSSSNTDDEGSDSHDFGSHRRRRSSIKLSSLDFEIPLHPASQKSSWKMLPKPDMDQILRTRSLSLSDRSMSESSEELTAGEWAVPATPPRQSPQRQTVSFDQVQIRYFRQTLGDNPSVSYGPPIQLDWKFEEAESLRIDDYELNRPSCLRKTLNLNHYHRVNLLQHFCGHSKEELKAAQKTVERAKFKRALSNFLLPVQALEDAAESGLRKTKRLITMSPKKTPAS